MQQEKRQHLRLEYNVPLKISNGHGDIVTETKNLSCSGIYCRVSQRLDPMTKLKVLLLLPLHKNNSVSTKKIACQGVVVRAQAVSGAQEYYDTAIFFNDIAPKDSRAINEFIESMLEGNIDGKYN